MFRWSQRLTKSHKTDYIHLLVLDPRWCKIVLSHVFERSFSQRKLPRCTYGPVPDFYSLPYWFLLILNYVILTRQKYPRNRKQIFFGSGDEVTMAIALGSKHIGTHQWNASFQITWRSWFLLCRNTRMTRVKVVWRKIFLVYKFGLFTHKQPTKNLNVGQLRWNDGY